MMDENRKKAIELILYTFLNQESIDIKFLKPTQLQHMSQIYKAPVYKGWIDTFPPKEDVMPTTYHVGVAFSRKYQNAFDDHRWFQSHHPTDKEGGLILFWVDPTDEQSLGFSHHFVIPLPENTNMRLQKMFTELRQASEEDRIQNAHYLQHILESTIRRAFTYMIESTGSPEHGMGAFHRIRKCRCKEASRTTHTVRRTRTRILSKTRTRTKPRTQSQKQTKAKNRTTTRTKTKTRTPTPKKTQRKTQTRKTHR